MSAIFDENEKEMRQLVFKELDNLKKQGNEAFLEAIYEGMAIPCSHYSSSTLVSCSQIHKPKDHVHFEEYETIDEYLESMTDVEYHWFARQETDCSKTTYQAWDEHQFFNLKAAVHYKKFGDALLFSLCRVNPIMISGIMEDAYRKGNESLAFNILTSSQIECPQCFSKVFKFETPPVNYVPAIVNAAMVQVERTDSTVEKSVTGEIASGVLITDIDDVVLPESWVGKGLDFLNKEKEKGQVEAKCKVDEKRDLVVVTPLQYPWNDQFEETSTVREVLRQRECIFGEQAKIATQEKEPVIAFSMKFGRKKMVCATPPVCIPSISILRWLCNVKKYPPLQFCVPMAAEKVMDFKLGGTLVFSMDQGKVFLSPSFKNRTFFCDCVSRQNSKSKNKGEFCREHGVTGTISGAKASLFRAPREEDTFVFVSTAPGVYTTHLLTKEKQGMGPRFKNYYSRKDQQQLEVPYSWPVPSLLGSPPLGYLMRTYFVPISFEEERNFLHVTTGKQRGKKNFFPIEILLLYREVPEESIGHTILTYMVWLEENLSFFDLGLLKGNTEVESRLESVFQRNQLLKSYGLKSC